MSAHIESTGTRYAKAENPSGGARANRPWALVAGILAVAITVPGARAGAKPAAPVPDGAQLYSLNCVVCHGTDGKGTETGKSLKAADLGSVAVQKQTDVMLAQAISDGKNNMPPFMSTLSKANIQTLVAYVRTFAKKAK